MICYESEVEKYEFEVALGVEVLSIESKGLWCLSPNEHRKYVMSRQIRIRANSLLH